jgi:hypothetical protein
MKHLRSLFGAKPVHPQPHPISSGGATPFVATHRHKKGGLYRLLSTGVYEADRSAVAIYDDEDGTIWVRSLAEFEDGRFKPITPDHS